MLGALISLIGIFFYCIATVAAAVLVLALPWWALADCAMGTNRSSTNRTLWILGMVLLWGLGSLTYGLLATSSEVLRRVTLGTVSLFLLSSLLGTTAFDCGTAFFMQDAPPSPPPPPPTAEQLKSQERRGIPEGQFPTVAPDALQVKPFPALVQLPETQLHWQVSLTDFTLSGPETSSSRRVSAGPTGVIRHVARVDSPGPTVFAITNHDVGIIDPNTGVFTRLPADPVLQKKIHAPRGLAVVPSQETVVVAGWNQGTSYNLKNQTWAEIPGFRSQRLAAIAYDAERDVLWGLVTDNMTRTLERLVKFSPDGALLTEVPLTPGIPTSISDPRKFQFVMQAGMGIVLESPFPPLRKSTEWDRQKMTIYLIDPESGSVSRVTDSESVQRPMPADAPPDAIPIKPVEKPEE